MKEFWKFYAWGMDIKLNMAIYTVGFLFFKCFFELLMGNSSVEIFQMLGLVIIGLILSILQHYAFPANKDFTNKQLINRTIIWAVLANIITMPLTIVFEIFKGIPVWGVALLIFIFEACLLAMWLGINVALKYDTSKLNEGLKSFQKR